MLPDSRRPRRLAMVISEIDTNADLDAHRRRRAGMTDWIWATADGGRDRDRHDVVDQQGGRRDQADDPRRCCVCATMYAPPPVG